MVLLGDEAKVDARLEIMLIFTQLRCLIGPNVTRIEIILDAPDGTPRRLGSCGISFRSIWGQC
jgi:hypothetical protein